MGGKDIEAFGEREANSVDDGGREEKEDERKDLGKEIEARGESWESDNVGDEIEEVR